MRHYRHLWKCAAAFLGLMIFGAVPPADGIEPPAINIASSGALTWSNENGTQIAAEAKVIDHHFSGNWNDYDVQVRLPDLTWHSMGYDGSSGTNAAYFWFSMYAAPVSGTYQFKVVSPDARTSEVVSDQLTVNVLDPPDEDSFQPSLKNPVETSISGTVDNVWVNGALYDNFDSYAAIGDLDPAKWQTPSCGGLSIDGSALRVDIADAVGMQDCAIRVSDPSAVNTVQADLRVLNASGDVPDTRIMWSLANNGNGDVFAGINLGREDVEYWVLEAVPTGDTLALNFLAAKTIKKVPLGETVTASISWDGGLITFNIDGISDSYTPAGTIGPSSGPYLQVGGRMNLWTDTPTPQFSWTPVTDAKRHRVRLYNWNNSKTIWQGYTGPSGSYQIPPGVLTPGGVYRYRLYANDTHDNFFRENVSYVPASSGQRYVFFAGPGEPQAPYIELYSGVVTWSNEFYDPFLGFWIIVDDAQGVPDNIKSVTVTHPDGVTETVLHYDQNDSSNRPTRGVYRSDSRHPVAAGTYTFVVEDTDHHRYTTTETLTANPIGYPDPATFTPASGSVLGTTAVNFDWPDVPGMAFYRVEIYNKDMRRIHAFATTESQYHLPAGILQEETFYRYRITTRREFFEENVDNGSASPGGGGAWNGPTFMTTRPAGSNTPSLSLDNYGESPVNLVSGAVVWVYQNPQKIANNYWLEFYVRVADLDGVPENIDSVTVTFPDLTTVVELRHMEQISATEAAYFGSVIFSDPLTIPTGTYTFRAVDFEANPAIPVQDDLTVDTLGLPAGFNLKNDGTVYGTTPTIDWGDITGAEKYRVKLYDGWGGTLHYSGFLTESTYTVPDGILELYNSYRYRVYVYGENVPGTDLDNYSTSDAGIINRWLTTSSYMYVASAGTCDGNLPCYADISSAIDQMDSLAVLQVAEGAYAGNVSLDEDKKIVIEGCYDAGYNFTPGKYATINGALTIANGEATIKNLIIR